jgi:7-cyano-7-deazaguanine tRNA-ribosyltransferase
MDDILEIKDTDLNGRIGILYTKHGKVELPTFVPVIHPIRQEVPIEFIKSLGFKLVITNAYITLKQYGISYNKAIHEIINFDNAIMTDSGGYQVLEYGDIDVKYNEIVEFEKRIDSDIAIPLDKPTGFKLDRDTAEEYVNITLRSAEESTKIIDNDRIWVGPIQGGKYLDLIKYSTKRLNDLGYSMFALGSPTEVMETYEFKTLAEMIVSAKSVIPINKPLHLFGAGNPLTIPLSIALGCDTFDSASYILYAKDDRYMSYNGTLNLQDIKYLPCNCPICSRYSIEELKSLPKNERIIEIAKHNLYTIKREVDNVKQAIIDGRLWEYVIQKSYAHPKLYSANEILKSIKFEHMPIFKDRAVFFSDYIDQYRPEAMRFKEIVKNLKYKGKSLILIPEQDVHPLYMTDIYTKIRSKTDANIAYYSPFLSIVPEELSDLFPAAHHLSANNKFKLSNFPTFIEPFIEFIKGFDNIIVLADDFIEEAIKELNIRCVIVKSYDELIRLIDKI